MYCVNCGFETNDDDVYCGNCGEKIVRKEELEVVDGQIFSESPKQKEDELNDAFNKSQIG